MADVKAQLNSARLAPRKVRAVANLLKGKSVSDALFQLEHMVRKPSLPLMKLIKSALANAENNFDMVADNLFVKSILVNEGIKLKRFMPKALGMVNPIQKKTSHIIVILSEKKAGLKREKTAKEVKTAEKVPAKTESAEQGEKKPEVKREIGSKGNALGKLGRKIFSRKAI